MGPHIGKPIISPQFTPLILGQALKFHAETPLNNSIEASGEGWVQIAGQRHEDSLLLSHEGQVTAWAPRTFEELDAEVFGALASNDLELVVLGTGQKHRFVRPEVFHPLIDRGIGLETMSSAAACRTYNVLISEGRKVLLALIQEH